MEDNNRKLSSDESSLMSINELLKNNDQYLLNIIHDLRSHLNVITSAAQFMEHNYKDDKNLKYIEIIKRNSFKMLKLINNLIDSNKIKNNYYKLNKKNIDIVPMIENTISCIEKFASERNINLIFDTNEEECIMAIDPEAIDRVIMNLLSNAIKFSKKNGTIKVSVEKKLDFIVINIKDNGIGIPKDKVDFIFGSFNQIDKSLTRLAEGMGMGLCIAKKLADIQGLYLNVESEENKGSQFKILIKNTKNSFLDVKYKKDIHISKEFVDIQFSDIYLN